MRLGKNMFSLKLNRNQLKSPLHTPSVVITTFPLFSYDAQEYTSLGGFFFLFRNFFPEFVFRKREFSPLQLMNIVRVSLRSQGARESIFLTYFFISGSDHRMVGVICSIPARITRASRDT